MVRTRKRARTASGGAAKSKPAATHKNRIQHDPDDPDRFQVVFFHAGQRHLLEELPSRQEAERLLDVLTVKQALDEGQDLAGLKLRGKQRVAGLPSVAKAACKLSGSSLAEVLQHAQECAEMMSPDEELGWHSSAFAAAYLGHCTVLHLMVLLERDLLDDLADEGSTLMHAAAEGGSQVVLQLLVDWTPEDATACDHDGRMPLHVAAHHGRDAAVQLLLAAAPEAAEAGTDEGSLPLHLAALGGHTAVMQLLLAAAPHTASAVTSFSGSTPLHFAAGCGAADAVRLLLNVAPETQYVRTYHGALPLHSAARGSCPVVVRQLLASDPRLAEAVENEQSQETPLHLAAGAGNGAVIPALLEAAPKGGMRTDADGYTPLLRALHSAARWDCSQHSLSAAYALLGSAPPVTVMMALATAPHAHCLFADLFILHRQLSKAQWALVPTPCAGLARALPGALAHSDKQAGLLVQHLPPEDAARLRTAALCFARVQRRNGAALPLPLLRRLLVDAVQPRDRPHWHHQHCRMHQ